MNRHWRILPLAALLLGGCATVSDDPREGGLFGGIEGLLGGGYEERIEERETQLQQEQETSHTLESEGEALERERRMVAQTLQRERNRLDRLSADTAELEQQIAALSAEQGRSGQATADLEQRLAALKRKLGGQKRQIDALEGGGGGTTAADLQRAQLESQRRALQQEYETLLELTLQLAQ